MAETMSPSAITVSPDDGNNECGVKDPLANDVLCGRGGIINDHPGNERFRKLVEKRKRVYLTARSKREKRLIAISIVSEIQSLNGRFLSRDSETGLWKDITDEKAREKTCQALRENAPSIRAEMWKDESSPHSQQRKRKATLHISTNAEGKRRVTVQHRNVNGNTVDFRVNRAGAETHITSSHIMEANKTADDFRVNLAGERHVTSHIMDRTLLRAAAAELAITYCEGKRQSPC